MMSIVVLVRERERQTDRESILGGHLRRSFLEGAFHGVMFYHQK